MNKKRISAKRLKLICDTPESSAGSILNTFAESTILRDILVVSKVILHKTGENIKIRNFPRLDLLVVALFCVATRL
jgi:hypothetical protein